MPKRDDAHMADQRRRILEAAFACLIENENETPSIRQICHRAGVSNGALYTHFRNKQDIILALVEDYARDWDLQSFQQMAQFRDYFHTTVRETRRDGARYYKLNIRLLHASLNDEKLRAVIQKSITARRHAIAAILGSLRTLGQIRKDYDVDAGAHTLNIIFEGIHTMIMNDREDEIRHGLGMIDAEFDRMAPRR